MYTLVKELIMLNKTNLYNLVKKISKEVRFGNLLNRISPNDFTEDKEFINDFNNMLDAISDREKMIKEYQSIILSNNEFLKSMFNMLNEGALSLSENFDIITINDTQTKWFRQQKKKLIGENILNILKNYTITDFETNEPIIISKDSFATNKKNYKLNFKLKNIQMTFSVSIKQFFDSKGNLNYFIVSKDVTPDVKMQQQRDTFIATLTHDLKVPILAEAKVLELLSKETFGKLSDFQKEAVGNMISNNSDMLSLVTTLLDVYRIEDGVYKINPTNCNIVELVNSETEKLKYIADTNSITIRQIIESKKHTCFVDPNEISRVIRNLLSNAINFAPKESEIIIKIFEKEKFLAISVSDKGKGISKENLPHIFERYFTTDKKYRKVGTGLGLYLSKKIVNIHGGEITAESTPEQNTTFTINLPLKELH